ncbi:MAG TPA: TolC family protein [Gemmatimonadaceae bacterium]|nr:TolC family protein [Gemmatimonadaceae bacterium]
MTTRYLATLMAIVAAPLWAQNTPPQTTARPNVATQPAGPTQTITFDEAITIALRQNTTLKQASNVSAVNSATVRQERLSFLPDFRFNTTTGQNYGRTFSQDEGRIIDQTTQSVNAGVSSSVTLFNGMSNIASLRSAKLSEDAGERNVQRAEQTVAFTVASNFLALVQQQEQVGVQQENLTAQEAQEKQIQAYVNAGSRAISDLYQQQATVAAARSQLVNAQRALELAKVDIIQALNLDPRGSYAFTPPALDTTTANINSVSFDMDSLLTRALSQRSDLFAQQAAVSAAQQDVKAAKGGRWPALSLTAGYNSAYNSATSTGFYDQLDQRRGGSIALGFSLPLFDRGAVDLATQKAEIAEDNARLDLKDRQQQIGLEVRRAYLDYVADKQQLDAAGAQLRAAQLALETSQQRYNVGAATLLEVTQARATQLQAQSALVTARYALLFQRTLIGYYTGDLNPRAVSIQ